MIENKFSNPYPPAPEKFRNGEFGSDEVHRLRAELGRMKTTIQRHEHQLTNRELGDSKSPFKRFIMDQNGKLFSVRLKKDLLTGAMNIAITDLDDDPDTEEKE